ncbi:MAG: NUDIX domain-containing protein [Candidatus Izimaplasma sp.]|nr:NUDIX domain-containing protein [Candidatus Izimaplasma bacterium]
MKLLKIFDKRDTLLGHQPIIYQDSVRAIILKQRKILLVFSKISNEYKFPGGGVNEQEIRHSALKREVLEETGREVSSVNESLGYIDQIYNDVFNERAYFYLRSFYYFCEITDEEHSRNLNAYERKLKFVPKWVTLEEAIKVNQAKYDKGSEHHWTERELYILKLLKEMKP